MEHIFTGVEELARGHGIDTNILRSFLNEDTAKKLSYSFIESISEDHAFVPQFNIHVSTRTILINNEDVYLELELLEPRHEKKIFVSNNNCCQAIGVLKGTASIRFYSAPASGNEQVLFTKEVQIEANNTIEVNQQFYVVDNPSEQPLILLYATNKKSISRGSSVPAYRIDTGKFSHFVSSRLTSSRIETMLTIMAEMGYRECSEVAKDLASSHEDYFVRWEAIRTYLRLNPEAAVPYLTERLKTETHPHVLNAATKSLDLIKRNYVRD